MDTPTPRIEMLLRKMIALNKEVTKNMNKLVARLGHLESEEEPLVLLPAVKNIVDRAAHKKKHRASWKVTLQELSKEAIEFEEIN